MQLTITTLDDQIFTVDVSEELELENLKAQCEFELGVSAAYIVLMWNGRPLQDGKKTLKDYGIGNGEVLLLQQMRGQPQGQAPAQSGAPQNRAPMIDFGSIQLPGTSQGPAPQQQQRPAAQSQRDLEDPAMIRDLILNNPHERALLKERNPPLSEALESGNKERFIEVYKRQRNERLNKEREQLRLLQMDPLNPEAQKLIAEEIRLKNVESNMESAIEFVPESFGTVVMLYIDCRVNGHHVKAFVDSGAQMTIMSQACAERCNIMRLVDTRWAGIAKGVGTQTIIGRVHLGQIQIGNDFLQSSFSILENQPMDMLLGLDMLRRHQCVIDLQNNKLVIGTTGAKTDFLPESELPPHARVNQAGTTGEPMDEDRELAKALQKSAEEASGSTNTSTTGSKPTVPSPTNSGNGAASTTSASIPRGASASATSQGGGGPSGFPESVIKNLVEKGYSRSDVIQALHEANGDEGKAVMNLFIRSIKK